MVGGYLEEGEVDWVVGQTGGALRTDEKVKGDRWRRSPPRRPLPPLRCFCGFPWVFFFAFCCEWAASSPRGLLSWSASAASAAQRDGQQLSRRSDRARKRERGLRVGGFFAENGGGFLPLGLRLIFMQMVWMLFVPSGGFFKLWVVLRLPLTPPPPPPPLLHSVRAGGKFALVRVHHWLSRPPTIAVGGLGLPNSWCCWSCYWRWRK